MVCGALAGCVHSCATLPDIDLATWIREDHNALQSSFRGIVRLLTEVAESAGCSDVLVKARQSLTPKYNADSLRDWYRRDHFQFILRNDWLQRSAEVNERCSGHSHEQRLQRFAWLK